MARPKVNAEQMRNRLIEEAEALLAETHGQRLILSDIADRLGISQPYVHRFFATKADLIRELALRWFAEVETLSREAVAADVSSDERLELWLLSLLRLKRDRYDANPALFDAYLKLAGKHPDLVSVHTARLHADLTEIVASIVPKSEVTSSVQLVEDATILFRIPHNISMFRGIATDERAIAVIQMLKKQLG